jgi:hypothetical protein
LRVLVDPDRNIAGFDQLAHGRVVVALRIHYLAPVAPWHDQIEQHQFMFAGGLGEDVFRPGTPCR